MAIDVPSENLLWKSLNPEIAMVDNTGKVTAISTGVATIMVTTADKSKTATCKITVTSELTPKQIFGKYGDAVVYIEVSDKNRILTGSGSGFIVNSHGNVVTNYHVIKGSSYANVTLQDGTKYDVKSVLNYNEEQDIAILQLTNATNLNVTNWYSDSSAGLFGIDPSTMVYFRVSAIRNGIEGDQSEVIKW